MKKIFGIALLLAFQSVTAAPVLNHNMASAGNNITIWPDHKDPDQFYFAPTIMKLAKDSSGKAAFHGFEFEDNCRMIRGCRRKFLMTSYFEAGYRNQEFQEAKSKIQQLRPKARFSPIPFMGSSVDFGTVLTPFIDTHNCSAMGGQSTDVLPCTIVLNEKGIRNLVPNLLGGGLVAFNYRYKILGVVDVGAAQFKEAEKEYSIAVNLGGEDLKNHPDLVQ